MLEIDGLGRSESSVVERYLNFELRLASVGHSVLEVINSHGEEGQVAAHISELVSHLNVIKSLGLTFLSLAIAKKLSPKDRLKFLILGNVNCLSGLVKAVVL